MTTTSRKKPSFLLPIAFLLLSVFSCDSRENSVPSYANDVSEESSVPLPVSEEDTEQAQTDRKLVKTGFIIFETPSLSATQKSIEEAIGTYQAYASLSQTDKYSGRISNTIVVRIPADNFDKFVAAISEKVEEFDRREIETADVTEEFVDIQARLETKKALEKRYLDLLQQTKKVSEILEIEKQAGELRADIEAIEGRLRYLNSQIAYATLTITFYEEVATATSFGQQFESGFRNGWKGLVWFFVALVNVWPFILIVVGVVVGVRIWRKRKA